jgi:PAS domain S-box-containing protein
MAAKKILIIEDDVAFSKTLKNILMLNGYEADVANSGTEGVRLAYERRPDLILCDIRMSPVNGYQVYNILKDSNFTNRIPFIFITGKSDLREIRFGMELGVDDYIVKPFQNETLLRSIKVRIEKYESLINMGRSRYQSFVENSRDGIFLFNGDQIYEINPAFSQLMGCRQADVKSLSFSKLIGPDNYKKIEERIDKCSYGLLNDFQEEIEIQVASGTCHPYSIRIARGSEYNGISLLIGLLAPADRVAENVNIAYSNLIGILEDSGINLTETLTRRLRHEYNPEGETVRKYSIDGALVSEVEFSKRELEVLQLSCQGLPMKKIAEKLFIADRTVESHRANMMEKTGAKNVIELIIFALKYDLVDI